MTFKYKESEYHFPALLSEITLSRRIAFYQEHGKLLDEKALAVEKLNGLEKEMEQSMWHLDNAARYFSFYTGIPLAEVQSSMDLTDMMNIYSVDIASLLEQERTIELQQLYGWQNEIWTISAPELLPDNKMTLIEFITGKEVVRQLDAVGKGKWEALPYLCAIYLRKEGEPFDESMIAENSERIKLMLEIPLDIALGVAFFLSSTLNIYITTLASSERESPEVSIPPAISTAGAG